MTAKTVLMAGALTLSSLAIANARTYDIKLDAPAKAGSNELKAGQYKVKVEGSQATITDAQNSKSTVTVPVKVENTDKKFQYTSVESKNQDGVDTIQAIDLGGSSTRLAIGQ
jgi:hypothetical protein